jgi:hypothetical protein
MRTEINNFEKNKKNYIKDLLYENNQKFLKIKTYNSFENEFVNYLRKNRINGFKRAYENIKIKLDDNKGRTVETECSPEDSRRIRNLENYYLFRNNYIDCFHEIKLPNVKCEVNDVYSRLFHNKVLLNSKTDKYIKFNKKHEKKPISLLKHLHFSKNDIFSQKALQLNPKFKLSLKNVLKSNTGKEFTTKVTDEEFKKCLDKYSGGPEVLKFLNEQLANNKNDSYVNKFINTPGFVNFYELKEKDTGNSYVHLAVEGDCPELIKYFIEKGANINKQNKDGQTPLHLALKNKNMEIIGILLDNKAKLNIPNNEGEIPFDYFTSDMKKQFGLEKTMVFSPIRAK